MKAWILNLAFGLPFAAALIAFPSQAAVSVVNGDFEADAASWVTWPGYAGNGGNPANIPGWTGAGGRGINPVVPGAGSDSPFDDPSSWNKTRFAFIQGTAHIEQTVTGFSVGGQYVLSLDFNSRGCCGEALPKGIVTLDGNVVASTVALAPPSGALPTAVDPAPWYRASVNFTATSANHVLRIATEPAPSGDSTLVVDNVRIAAIPEPSSLGLCGLSLLLGFRRRR